MTKDELRALLTAARARRERDFLMILVAYNHGLRATELISITANDLKDGYLRVMNQKQRKRKAGAKAKPPKPSKPKIHPLLDNHEPIFSEREPLLVFARNHSPGDRLFPVTRQRFWQIVKEHAESAGIPEHRAFCHALRHSCARQLIDVIGIHRTQAWLGHKSMQSTGVYLEPSQDDVHAAARRALDGNG